MKIISWNVNGIRACQRKGFLDWIKKDSPDILGLQEIKANKEQLDLSLQNIDGYFSYFNSAEKKGYSGVALYTKKKPIEVKFGFGIERFDREGRVIIAEYEDFFFLNIYFPNGQRDEERLKFKLDFYDTTLEFCEELKKQGKAIIISGDYNTAHTEIDLANPKNNEKTSGFLPIERAWIDKFIKHGYIDTFREQNKEPEQYSWWSYRTAARTRNVGWRIDYHFITTDLKKKLKNAYISQEVLGSDHCPVVLEIEN